MFIHRYIAGHVLFQPKGDLSFFNVTPFSNAISDSVKDSGTAKVVIDCGGLNMFDSAALGELVRLAQRLTGEGGYIRLANVGPKVHQGIYSMRIEDLLKPYNSIRDALDDNAEGIDELIADLENNVE